ncbi:hypothetical protein C9994_12630 [Marivirga lumbricoides]|uniref:Peptidase C39-like domain-containing protein n=1 Tax=Marivirga lumbricoides TaxID=1046115 RepID=A0A2T4DJ60_9BACT|nr:hypothetical protein C9994_12630 [Marivirga lumbricoides]
MAFQSKDSSSEGHKREQQFAPPPRQYGLQPRQMGRTMGRSMNRWNNPLPSVDFSKTTQTKVSDPGYPEHTISTKGKIEDARPVTVTIPEESLLSEVQELPPERVIPELQESVGRGGVNRKEDVEIVQYYLLELGLLSETDTLPQEAGTLLEEAQIPHLIAALYTFQEEVLHWQNRDANIGGPSSKTLEALKTITPEQAKAQMEKYPAIKAKREADAAAKAKADAEAQKKREQERAKLKASQAAKKKEQERIEKLKNEASDQNSVENKLKGLESNKEIAAFLIDYVDHNPAFVIQAIKNNSGWIANENTDDLSFAILTKIGKSKLGSIDKELLQYFRATLDSGWTGDEELEWMQAIDRVLSGSVESVGLPSENKLDELMKKERLTPEEVKEARGYIEILDEPKVKEGLFFLLQEKVLYANQRDNISSGEKKEGGTCNLTALAMALSYLGVSNPNSEKQYEDALEDLRVEKELPARTTAAGWGGVAKELGVKYEIIKMNFTGSKDFFQNDIKIKHLEKGHSVMLSIGGTSGGHIIRLQSINDSGVIVDDPFGKSNLKEGSNRAWDRFNDPSSEFPERNYNNQGENVGEDILWPWEDVTVHKFRWIAYLKIMKN